MLILRALAGRLSLRERMKLGHAARSAGRSGGLSSMSEDFARPVGGAAQAVPMARLFEVATPDTLDIDDPASLLAFATDVAHLIGAAPQRLDFLSDRLNRHERASAGFEVSKRQYNRRFRALQRLAAKAHRLDREWAKRRLTLGARAGFAGSVTLDGG